MKEIISDNQLIAKIVSPEDWTKGLNFFTDNDDFIQVGSWWYDKERYLADHIHLKYPRTGKRTQECVFVVSGRMKINFFSENQEFLESCEVGQGDFAVIFGGGHGYEILEDDTKILETKNGPFTSVEKDKIKF